MKMSDAWLQNAKPRQERYDVTVTNRTGLMVRVHPSGAISFRFRYKRTGETFVIVFGEYGTQGLSLKCAYDMHEQARRELEQNLDPIEEQEKRDRALEQARRNRADGDTVADIVEQFMHRRIRAERWDEEMNSWVRDPKSTVKPRKRPEKAWQILKPNLVDKIGEQKAADVTKRKLVELLEEIVDRGSPVQANRAYGLFKQCFSFAAGKDLIPASPMAGIDKPAGNSMPRDRALTADEIRTFWTKLDDPSIKMEPMLRLALKILLLTAQRRGEISQAYWSQIDFEAAVWSIPRENSKNDIPHKVPLSPMALDLFKQLHAITGKHERVLPHAWGNRFPNRCVSEAALSKAMRRNQKLFGLTRFTTHDLRRTASTVMASLKIPRLHIEKVLNHTVHDIAEIYDRHDYFEQKLDALTMWAEHLQKILDTRDSNVVPFRKQAHA